MVAKTLSFVASFALPLLLVRRLDQAEFGLYKQVFLVATTAVALLPFGFGMSAFYFLPREREKQEAVVLNILFVYACIGGLAFLALLLFPSLLVTLFNGPELRDLSPLIGFLIMIWIMSSLLECIPVAHQELKLGSALILASQLVKTILLLAAAVVYGTVLALIVAGALFGLVQFALLLWYLRSRFAGFLRGPDWPFLRVQLAYATPLGLITMLYVLQLDLHHYLVSYFYGPAEYAVYAVGCFQLPLVGIIFDAVGSILIPRVGVLHKEGQNREIVLLMARVMRKVAAVFFPLYVFLMLFGKDFIVALFTAKFLDSWPIFVINLMMLPFGIILLDSLQRSYGELRYFFLKLRIVSIVLMVPMLILATKYFGLIGAISVAVGGSLLERMVGAIHVSRVLDVGWKDLPLMKDVGKLAAASVIAGAVSAAIRLSISVRPITALAVCAAVFGIVYVLAILALSVLTPEEHASLRGQISRLQRTVS
jgi:O-antigen/teichoic acid export membrane protein